MATSVVTFLTAFLGGSVESIEALTVILAVGLSRGWRSALEGTAVGIVVLVALVVTLGGLVFTRIPENTLRLAIGVLILLFGARWLRKASLRAAGVTEQRNEALAFQRVQRRLASERDPFGFAIALQAVLLEGTEVAVIVVAASAGASLAAASAGAAVGVLSVAAVGVLIRKPLTRVPENTLKYVIGVALSSLGTFWALEGLGFDWPLDIGSVLPLAAIYFLSSQLAIGLYRRLDAQVAAAP